MTRGRWVAAIVSVGLAVAAPLLARRSRDRFDHWQHRALFPTCSGCHAGVEDAAAPVWPAVSACIVCHDGSVKPKVDWTPPEPPRTNLRFTHPRHTASFARVHRDSSLSCGACHNTAGGERMRVELAAVKNCLDCHGVRASHLEAPDTACATCHVPLTQAARLTEADVAQLPIPPSHQDPDFRQRTHGDLARRGPANGFAASCATCHAQNFCASCHVNAPEVPAIRALARDRRVRAPREGLRAPPSHAKSTFVRDHGAAARASARNCSTCHTRESCLTCHVGAPRVASALPAASPLRGAGAAVTRRRPASHGADFSERHAGPASVRPTSCAGCHARTECLDCHRPGAGSSSPGYHPTGFLTTHPVAAYRRSTECANCHNTAQFCTACHASAGLTTVGRLDAGYHDAKRFFLLGHGQAARQSLESCVACHTERDCTTCHATSAVGGRGFDPHGPGFDAERLRRRNPQMCTACHGAATPGAGQAAPVP